ncbi:uncharacterized protein LOC123953904 [Meles meles]|uniref:uncharacterized protein LOC123953904 n=1 Tax=Meles meles TaxID=9662 RepID=UPI001E69FB7A|nr:uncharacterized protein LOC123953904 [Meles meles]
MKSAVPPFRVSTRLLQSWKQGSSHPLRAAIAAAPLYSTLCGGPRPSREAAVPGRRPDQCPAPGPLPSPPSPLVVVSKTKAPNGDAECLYPLRRSWSQHLQNEAERGRASRCFWETQLTTWPEMPQEVAKMIRPMAQVTIHRPLSLASCASQYLRPLFAMKTNLSFVQKTPAISRKAQPERHHVVEPFRTVAVLCGVCRLRPYGQRRKLLRMGLHVGIKARTLNAKDPASL